MHLVYLHGYATNPTYVQARYFADRLAQVGHTLHVPDLNVPDFARLTLTGAVERAADTIAALPDGPVGLIGSSMGGAVALHCVDRYGEAAARQVNRLFLIAPAFDLAPGMAASVGVEGMARWRDSGSLDVYHYAYEEVIPLHYGFYSDAQQYDSHATDVRLPTLIFHGTNDEAVDYRRSVHYAGQRPWVELHLIEGGDHQLLDHLDTMFDAAVRFFAL